jgi:hypothetical protein
VKTLAGLLVAATAALAVLVSSAGATNECRGLQVCAHVAGPWVVVPSGNAVPRPRAEYQLTCPKGFVVGGLDAELTDRAIDVTFQGLVGAPVNPGITTSRTALFVATSARTLPRGATFRPHIGCLPTSGGGQRIPTVAHVSPPGHPDTRRVTTARIEPGPQRVTKACAPGETLVSATHAIGFFTSKPPSAGLASSVHASQTVRGGRVTVSVHADGAVVSVRAVVQVDLTCGGGA